MLRKRIFQNVNHRDASRAHEIRLLVESANWINIFSFFFIVSFHLLLLAGCCSAVSNRALWCNRFFFFFFSLSPLPCNLHETEVFSAAAGAHLLLLTEISWNDLCETGEMWTAGTCHYSHWLLCVHSILGRCGIFAVFFYCARTFDFKFFFLFSTFLVKNLTFTFVSTRIDFTSLSDDLQWACGALIDRMRAVVQC